MLVYVMITRKKEYVFTVTTYDESKKKTSWIKTCVPNEIQVICVRKVFN